ncbi:MAG: response regulator [Opitutaceae bacterium]|nr:response regulator [Opitutaceae bacterium]
MQTAFVKVLQGFDDASLLPSPFESMGGMCMNILVAEDDEGFVLLMREIFGAMPEHETLFCGNGLEAWWHLTDPTRQFDVVILDINMPHIDGLTLLARMRNHPSFTEMAVIISTGLTARNKITEAGTLRATHYLVKPFPPSTLIEKVKLVEQQLGMAVKEIRIA